MNRKPNAVVLAILLGPIPTAWGGETSLHMESDPGDWVGQGNTYSYDEKDGSFSCLTWDGGQAISISVNDPAYSFWWNLDFGTLSGEVLAPSTYKDATRWPFNETTEPGLSVGGMGRGCNTLTGQFTVHEIEFDGDMVVVSLWISFEQHCEGDPPLLWGDLKINAGGTPVSAGSWGQLKALFNDRLP